jgi:hypothetical protein
VQESVAVPEPGRLLGVIALQVRPVGTVSVRLTVDVKWLSGVMVIVELAD